MYLVAVVGREAPGHLVVREAAVHVGREARERVGGRPATVRRVVHPCDPLEVAEAVPGVGGWRWVAWVTTGGGGWRWVYPLHDARWPTAIFASWPHVMAVLSILSSRPRAPAGSVPTESSSWSYRMWLFSMHARVPSVSRLPWPSSKTIWAAPRSVNSRSKAAPGWSYKRRSQERRSHGGMYEAKSSPAAAAMAP